MRANAHMERYCFFESQMSVNDRCHVSRHIGCCMGGYNEDGDLNSHEFYQAVLNIWMFSSPLQKRRSGCTLVATDQQLFALGGLVNGKCSTSVERIGYLREKWMEIQSMQTPTRRFAAMICNRSIFAVGGQTNYKNIL